MKQQFLDLNGLTELVTYLKKSITEQKEILPYASNKLFPSTGNVNCIYIDTATNSIYRWDSSNKKYEILAKAVKSVSISESTENGKITLTVDGVKTTVPIHGLKSAAYTESSAYATAAQGVKAESAVQSISLASGTNNGTVKLTVDGKATDNIAVKGLGSAAYTASSAYATAGHTHTKAQIGLGNVDNTADKDKSVKHATTADNATTAGSATTATNVSGENATGDTARHVWFSRSDSETKRVYNDNFKYNPATNLLTTNITGSAASANSVAWTGVTGKPSSMPASDVYAWAKASTKPSYSWGEITGKPGTFTPASHSHSYITASLSSSAVPTKAADGRVEFYYNVNNGLANNMPSTNNANAIISLSRHAGDYPSQLGFSSDGNIYYREGVGTTAWKTIITSSNYTSYTTTKTGGGASGTWGINVSGGAAYPTGFNSRATSATWGNQTGILITDWHTSNGGDIQFRDNSGQLNVITDGFFYQNEGRNLVLDSVNYSNYAATKSHTHNYAGSSSAGGNANAAVKLANARKIGSASFDGTADITLSQMGLNVPVEITKADYLAKKKAGTLNANTYYNVIDEYDSANVINDSSVTANSAFSSTKSEKTYAKKSTLVTTTLTASKWTGSSAPYTYVLPVSGATTSNIVEINYASNASSQAIEAYQNAMLADGGQTTNQITIKATEKPTVDIPITIVIRNDL